MEEAQECTFKRLRSPLVGGNRSVRRRGSEKSCASRVNINNRCSSSLLEGE